MLIYNALFEDAKAKLKKSKDEDALFKDAKTKDDQKLGKLKDENALFEDAKAKVMNKQLSTKQEQGNVSVYTDRQSKALTLQSPSEIELANEEAKAKVAQKKGNDTIKTLKDKIEAQEKNNKKANQLTSCGDLCDQRHNRMKNKNSATAGILSQHDIT